MFDCLISLTDLPRRSPRVRSVRLPIQGPMRICSGAEEGSRMQSKMILILVHGAYVCMGSTVRYLVLVNGIWITRLVSRRVFGCMAFHPYARLLSLHLAAA